MGFTKRCPLCNENFVSLVSYMSHIKSSHQKISPEEFVKDKGEIKWSFKQTE